MILAELTTIYEGISTIISAFSSDVPSGLSNVIIKSDGKLSPKIKVLPTNI